MVNDAMIDTFQGIDAEYVSLENIVPEFEDDDPSSDGTLDAAFYDRLANALAERISQCSHRVPVVTGQSFDF
jgi:aspartate kinase